MFVHHAGNPKRQATNRGAYEKSKENLREAAKRLKLREPMSSSMRPGQLGNVEEAWHAILLPELVQPGHPEL